MKACLPALVGAGLLLAHADLGAQERGATARVVDVSRVLVDSTPSHVRIEFVGGDIRVGAVTAPYLYRVVARTSVSRTPPFHAYDARTHTLRIGMTPDGRRQSPWSSRPHGQIDLAVSAAVPLDLAAHMVATRSAFDIGKLRANRVDIDAALSAVTVVVGDHAGPIETDLRVHGVLSALTITLSPDVAIKVDMQSMGGVTHLDFPRPEGVYVSPNWGSALQRVHLTVKSVFCRVRIERSGA